MSYYKLQMKKHLKNAPLLKENEQWYPLGWIALRCSCGAELTYPLDHVYGINETPKSFTHGECPICKKIHNVKVEVWE